MLKNKTSSIALSLILVFTLFASSLLGCGDGNGTTKTTESTTSTSTTTTQQSINQPVFEGMYSYDEFETPTSCGNCHFDIYSAWSKNQMAKGYTNSWKQVEYFQLAYAQSQQVEEVAGVASGCIMCHAPLAFLAGDIPPAPSSENPRANEGISCEICHSLTGSTESAPFNFSGIMHLGNTKYGPRNDSETTYHDSEFSAFVGSPQHCGLCHDEQSPYGAWVKETYREWAAGPFPAMDITCITCHMDTTKGKAALDGKERDDLAVHTFAAVHSPERMLDNIEIIPKVDSEQVAAGGTLKITTDLRCLMMGHSFPSGSTEERMLWMEVWATDSAGKRYHIPVDPKGFQGEEFTIADSTATAYSDMATVMEIANFEGISRDGDVPDGARIFRRPFFNPEGEMTIMQWYTAENTLVDYRFGPRETKTETYTWKLPADIADGPITIDFKIYFSLVPSSIADFLKLEEEFHAAYLTGSSSIIINDEPKTPPPTVVKTYGDKEMTGYIIFVSDCARCHLLEKNTLAWYGNAQNLLDKIYTMPGGNDDVLSFFLVEYGWVSADTIFDLDTLSDIVLTK
ncbi:MAG: multiheme c-type cytochrome [Dehalococcoidales bacterium]